MDIDNNRLSDKEFVLLSNIKGGIMRTIDQFCKNKVTNKDFYPDLNGNAYWIVKRETPYSVTILIRYVNTSSFLDVNELENLIENTEYVQHINLPIYITKEGGELEVTIFIKH